MQIRSKDDTSPVKRSWDPDHTVYTLPLSDATTVYSGTIWNEIMQYTRVLVVCNSPVWPENIRTIIAEYLITYFLKASRINWGYFSSIVQKRCHPVGHDLFHREGIFCLAGELLLFRPDEFPRLVMDRTERKQYGWSLNYTIALYEDNRYLPHRERLRAFRKFDRSYKTASKGSYEL